MRWPRSIALRSSGDLTQAFAHFWPLTALHRLTNECTPCSVPFVTAARGFSESQAAMLAGSFFPGYVIAMLPASLITKRIGEKAAVTINLFGSATACLLMPAAAQLGAYPLAAVLSLLGGCGFFFHCRGVSNKRRRRSSPA